MSMSRATRQPNTKRAAVYMRVSTEDQTDGGYGLDVQAERCKAQIVAKGWTCVDEYTDAGISGTKNESERPGLAALLERVSQGEIDAVIVLALDRLGRKARLVLELVEKLTDAGADLVSCKESLDTSTPQGRFVLTMFAALAELERDNIAERTTAGRNQRGRLDGERGGRIPMGYIRKPENDIMIDEPRAALVRRIFALRRTGCTLMAIAELLNAEGIQTQRGHIWHASSVREILKNERAYQGGKRWESEIHWPVILAA